MSIHVCMGPYIIYLDEHFHPILLPFDFENANSIKISDCNRINLALDTLKRRRTSSFLELVYVILVVKIYIWEGARTIKLKR